MKQIPVNKPLLFKAWLGVVVGILLLTIIAVVFFSYEITTADYFGAPVASVLLAYIIHLGFWNPGKE